VARVVAAQGARTARRSLDGSQRLQAGPVDARRRASLPAASKPAHRARAFAGAVPGGYTAKPVEEPCPGAGAEPDARVVAAALAASAAMAGGGAEAEEVPMLEPPVAPAGDVSPEACEPRQSTGGTGDQSPCGATPAAKLAGHGCLYNPGGLYQETPPVPPVGESWDWPLSRPEKKTRLTMLDRYVLMADNRLLEREVRMLRARSPSCCADEEEEEAGGRE